MRASHLFLGLLLVVTAFRPARAAGEPRLVDLQVEVEEDAYVASVTLVGVFTQEVLDEIASGLPVTFRYRIEVYRKRALWDQTLIGRDLSVTVDFDNLTKQYRLTRALDGDVIDSLVSEKGEVMRRWMTEVRRVNVGALPGDEPVEGAILLRVKCRLARGFVLFFFPYSKGTRWIRVPLERPSTEHAD